MGIKNLNNVIKTFTNINLEYISLDKFKNMTFAVDANLFIYRFLYGNGNHINGIFKKTVIGDLYHRYNRFNYNIINDI